MRKIIVAFDKNHLDSIVENLKQIPDDPGIDPVLWDYQRLVLREIVPMHNSPDRETHENVIEGVCNFMEYISDTFWPEVVDSLDEGIPYTQQLKKKLDES